VSRFVESDRCVGAGRRLARWRGGAVALAVVAAAAAARADPGRDTRSVEADYLITWMGLPVYSARFAGAWNGDDYRMQFRADALGIVRLAANTTIEWQTEGRLAENRLLPKQFTQANTFRRQTRRITLVYDRRGPPAVSVMPPESPGKRPPVPKPLQAGTIDPLSATLGAIVLPAATPRCGYEAKVFEGLRRTDIRLVHARSERTPSTRVGGFEQQALVCEMYAKRLAGYEDKHFRQNPEPLPPATLWVARHRDAELWLPVQLRFPSRYGPIYAHLVRVTVKNGGR
jgi:hypothetical protein